MLSLVCKRRYYTKWCKCLNFCQSRSWSKWCHIIGTGVLKGQFTPKSKKYIYTFLPVLLFIHLNFGELLNFIELGCRDVCLPSNQLELNGTPWNILEKRILLWAVNVGIIFSLWNNTCQLCHHPEGNVRLPMAKGHLLVTAHDVNINGVTLTRSVSWSLLHD